MTWSGGWKAECHGFKGLTNLDNSESDDVNKYKAAMVTGSRSKRSLRFILLPEETFLSFQNV